MNKHIWLKVTAIDLLMLCFSISVSVIGQMLGPISEAYSLNLTQSGWLLSSQSIGGIVLALIALFYSEMNKERFVLISGAILGIMILLIGTGLPVFLLFMVFALMGYSGSTINSLSNSVVSENVPPNKKDRHLVLLHMMFSVGAVITPLLSQYIYTRSGLKGVFIVLGAFVMLSVVYAFFAYAKQAAIKPAKRHLTIWQRVVDAVGIFKNPGMVTVFILAILIASAQLSMVYYVSSYFSQLGGSANYGAAALSVLFFCMLASRLVYSRIASRFSKGAVLAATNTAAFLSWGIMFFVPGAIAKIVLLGLGSLFIANNFPTVYSCAIDAAPDSRASAAGTVVLGYYIAVLAFLPAAGALGEAFGLKIAIASALAPIIGIVIIGVILKRREKLAKA